MKTVHVYYKDAHGYDDFDFVTATNLEEFFFIIRQNKPWGKATVRIPRGLIFKVVESEEK